MFGIGLPELILIMGIALIVVGPEKLPELAKTIAKGIVELKKAAGTLKESLNDDDETEAWKKVDRQTGFTHLSPDNETPEPPELLGTPSGPEPIDTSEMKEANEVSEESHEGEDENTKS